jgi:hypothetical protein
MAVTITEGCKAATALSTARDIQQRQTLPEPKRCRALHLPRIMVVYDAVARAVPNASLVVAVN